MRFQKGEHHPHPPRGRGRRPYNVSHSARLARRNNLSKSRLRSEQETAVIKRLIWQATFGDGPHLSQRELALELRVCRSYIHKVQHQHTEAVDGLTGQRVTQDDLLAAQSLSARLREHEPGLIRAFRSSPASKSRAMTDDESIAEIWREVNEWKRKNLSYGRRGWFRW